LHNGHRHRFRDTLAAELPLNGTPIERVSALLGHASIKATERHYSPWVQARQVQLEADVARAWPNGPIVQMETLRGEMASETEATQ
jgi:integrase